MRLLSCLDCGTLSDHSRCSDCEGVRRQGLGNYGGDWPRIRAEHLAMERACRSCGRPANEVDHIVERRAGGTDDDDNLQSLCKPCHSRKTRATERLGKPIL